MKKSKKGFLAALVSIFSATGAVSTHAEAGAQEADAIEEVIVTAQKREQSLFEVPVSVQSFSGAEIEAEGQYDINAVAAQIPGSVVFDNGGGSQTLHMRGSGVSSSTGDPTIGIYVDDTPYSLPNSQLLPPTSLLYDLERIEVLRGPQGTLYGQGSMGGTVKFLTKAPDLSNFGFKARVRASDTADDGENNSTVDMVVNIPIVEDVFAIRVAAGSDELGGYGMVPDLPNIEGPNKVETDYFRIKALWEPNENLSIAASYLTVDIEKDFISTFIQADPALLPPSGGFIPDNSTVFDVFSASIEWDLPFATLFSSTSVYDTSSSIDSGGAIPVPGAMGLVDLPFQNELENVVDSALTQEVRLVSNNDAPLQWIAGFAYSDIEVNRDFALAVNLSSIAPGDLPFVQPFAALVDSNSEVTLSTESYAFFGEVSYELLDGKLVPLFGLRYFEDDRSSTEIFNGLDLLTFTPLVNAVFSEQATFDSWNPRFNLSFYPNDWSMLYFNAAKGFRSGTAQLQVQLSALDFDGVPAGLLIEPDQVWTYEWGGKLDLLDGDLVVQGALFYNDWTDAQTIFTTSTQVNSVVQFGDIETLGLEWDVLWQTPIEGLSLSFTGAYTDSEFASVAPAFAAGIPQAQEGNDVPFTPEWTFNVSGTYTWPIGIADLDGFAHLAYQYRDETINYTQVLSDPIKDLAVRFGVQGEKWSAYVFGENVTNQSDVATQTTNVFLTRRYPRTVGVEFQFHFE